MILGNKENQALLALLAYALFGQEMSIDAASINWDRIVAEANRHAVAALLYPSVKRLAGVPDAVVDRIRNAAMLSAAKSDDMLHSQSEVIVALKEKGIPCAVLKGFSAACCYPYPELRVPGDIDLLVRADELDDACNVLEEAGFERKLALEKHVCLARKDAWVEMHRMVTTFPETPKGLYAEKMMSEAVGHTCDVDINGVRFPILDGVYQLIGLLAHKEQHLAKSGIGLRQICDWAVTIHAHRTEIGKKELAQLDRCGLLLFAKVITRMCEKYLGLPPFPWRQDVPDAQSDALMADILEAGNFHVQGEKRPFTDVLIDAYGTQKSSVLRNYSQYIRKRIRQDYPWAKSPFWIVVFGTFFPARYCIRVLIGRRKRINISSAVHTAKSREKMLRELKLYQ